MPRINNQILNCVFYLYPSGQAAQDDDKAGGTGFLVSVPSEKNKNLLYYYAVTNQHNVKSNLSGIRFIIDNGTCVTETFPSEWTHHPHDDLAVFPLDPDDSRFDIEKMKHTCINIDQFLTKEDYETHNIGPGSDVYMIGRFISKAKKSTAPIVRFGNISMLPWEEIENSEGKHQESILVEMRSISGCSGSPVFIETITYTNPEKTFHMSGVSKLLLLGVDWGHISIYTPIKIKQNSKLFDDSDNKVVELPSGQAGVIPAWKLRELLFLDKFVNARNKIDDLLATEERI